MSGQANPEEEIHPAIQNECDFLTYMRNKVCPKFAKYYCHKAIVPFSDGVIFLDYYPKNLKDEGMSEEKMMEIVEDVCLGLLFLSEEQVIHRDLKESNIMIDKSNRGRIIDFGSAFNTFGSVKFKPKDTKRTNRPTQFDQHQATTSPTKIFHPLWRPNLATKSSILTASSTSIASQGY